MRKSSFCGNNTKSGLEPRNPVPFIPSKTPSCPFITLVLEPLLTESAANVCCPQPCLSGTPGSAGTPGARSFTICGSWSRCNQTWWSPCSEAAWASGVGRKGRHSGVQAHLLECAALWQEVADLSGDPGTQLKKGISQDFADDIKNQPKALGA